jgi:hypothetical protein
MNYVFDIDGTICTDTNGDYASAQPILDRVNIVNKLYREGHQIILFTARGMGSSGNDEKKARKKWKILTEYQLKEWGVKYHHLFLGKPAGDIYIDDKGMGDKIFFNECTM